jgi:hypothetical protein
VTTSRQLEANRANARKSTGPSTPSGKKRSSRSSFRHGLSVPVVSVSLLSEQVEQLAQEIAVGSTSTFVLDHARRVAEAQMDLCRIRRVRHEIFAQIGDGAVLKAQLRNLRLLDRYERRAQSRRKRSIRDLACAALLERSL